MNPDFCALEASPDSGGVELFILDLEKWCWSHPLVQGAAPACRLGMAGAAFGPMGEAVNERRLYLFGGVVLRGEQVRMGWGVRGWSLKSLGFRSGKKHDVGVLMGEFFGQTQWIGHRLPRLFFGDHGHQSRLSRSHLFFWACTSSISGKKRVFLSFLSPEGAASLRMFQTSRPGHSTAYHDKFGMACTCTSRPSHHELVTREVEF